MIPRDEVNSDQIGGRSSSVQEHGLASVNGDKQPPRRSPPSKYCPASHAGSLENVAKDPAVDLREVTQPDFVPAWRADDETELPPALVFTAAASIGSQTIERGDLWV